MSDLTMDLYKFNCWFIKFAFIVICGLPQQSHKIVKFNFWPYIRIPQIMGYKMIPRNMMEYLQ